MDRQAVLAGLAMFGFDCGGAGSPIVVSHARTVAESCNIGFGDLQSLTEITLARMWGDAPTQFCGYQPDPTTGAVTATSACGPLARSNAAYCPLDDTITFDVTFLDYLSQTFHSRFTPVAVLAHEWGHLNQARLGLLQRGRPQILNELSADCQGGIYTGYARTIGIIQQSDVVSEFAAACAASDNLPWFAPGAHGDCRAREQSIQRGIDGYLQAQITFNTGGPAALAEMLHVCTDATLLR
jgi:hypothetical protein